MINFRNKIEERIYRADERRFEKMKGFITSDDKILKVGAGLGFQAQILDDYSPGNITIIEIENGLHPDIKLPTIIYDGKTFPFENDEFDISIANHVLHHTPNPDKVLQDIARVTTKRIIIVEELWTNWLQKISIIFNCWYKGYKLGEKGTKLYFSNYRSEKEWLETFKKCGLDIEFRSENWTSDKILNFRIGFFVLKKK